jgi:hypothetical protein
MKDIQVGDIIDFPIPPEHHVQKVKVLHLSPQFWVIQDTQERKWRVHVETIGFSR